MKYSIDTSSLIEAWRGSYPPDVFPSLWEKQLPAVIASGDLRATREVMVELERQEDELLEWVKQYESDLFVEVDEPVQLSVKEILESHSQLVSVTSWRSGADPFVVALAIVNGCSVVTEENPRSPINPRIPDVCSSYDVPCVKILELLRQEGWQFN